MKLEPNDIKWLSDNFTSIRKQVNENNQIAIEALFVAAVADELLKGLIDKKTIKAAVDKVRTGVNKKMEKQVAKMVLTADKAFREYGGISS